jgi:hypothetical protein
MIYLTMLSVAQTVECRMVERSVNHELKRIWKEAVVA